MCLCLIWTPPESHLCPLAIMQTVEDIAKRALPGNDHYEISRVWINSTKMLPSVRITLDPLKLQSRQALFGAFWSIQGLYRLTGSWGILCLAQGERFHPHVQARTTGPQSQTYVQSSTKSQLVWPCYSGLKVWFTSPTNMCPWKATISFLSLFICTGIQIIHW